MGTTPPNTPNPSDPRFDPRWQREQARAQSKANREAWKQYIKAQREQVKAYNRGLYRTSIVGPLILITMGVLFLLGHFGHLPVQEFLDLYARYWPLLLIAIGLVRLAEWLYVRHRAVDGHPVMYVLGGGARFLIFMLVLVGIGLSASHYTNWSRWNFDGEDVDHFMGNKHEADPAPLMKAIPANSSLFIRNPYGDVTVSGLSDDGQIHIQAHNEVWVRDDNEAEGRLRRLEPKLDGSGNTFSITVPEVESSHCDLKVTVPASTILTANTDHGDVHVGNLKGMVTLTSNRGNVEVKAVTGSVTTHVNNSKSDVSISNVTGAVSLEGKGEEVSISQINGPVTIHGEFYSTIHVQQVTAPFVFKSMRTDLSIARLDGELSMGDGDEMRLERVVGPVTLTTKNRNIEVARVAGDVMVSNRNGSVTISSVAPSGAINVDNRNGAVTVSMPNTAAFTVQADTSDGDVRSDFKLESKSQDNAGSLSGTVNGGGKALRISTSHGDINLNHADLAPLPKVPQVPQVPDVPAIPAVPPVPPVPSVPGIDSSKEGLKAAQDAVKEAQAQLKEAEAARKEALKEAEASRKEALKESEAARKQALKDAKKSDY